MRADGVGKEDRPVVINKFCIIEGAGVIGSNETVERRRVEASSVPPPPPPLTV